MIEIIPNWHPIFVHFTIALFSVSALLFCISYPMRKKKWGAFLLSAAYINLWAGALFTIATLIAGWYAYNTVAHDTASHAAMTDHRNWALFTAGLWGVLALWSVFLFIKKQINMIFIGFILVASGLLATTGYKGGEIVYRYGLGVMSLPQTDSHGHQAGSEDSHGHDNGNKPHHEGQMNKPKPNEESGQKKHDNSDGHHKKKDGHEQHKHNE